MQKAFDFVSKNLWIVSVLIIVLTFSLAFHVRASTYNLPVTDKIAENAVYNGYRQQIASAVEGQYPNLPNKQQVIDEELNKLFESNREKIEVDIEGVSGQYKDYFRDWNGDTYLLGIDPWYYYRQTRNVLEGQGVGTEVIEGRHFDSYKLAPVGSFIDANLHPYFSAIVYKITSPLTGFSLMKTFFFIGALISALSVIPAFFIAKKVSGRVGGFFASTLIAVSLFFVSRTAGESSDTDAYTVTIPLFVAWAFLESTTGSFKKRTIYTALTGLLMGVFSFAWTGWWYILYFLLVTYVIKIGYDLVMKREVWHDSTQLAIMVFSSAIFVMLITGFSSFWKAVRGPLGFINIKEVATVKIWPNVLRTVAELSPASFNQAIEQTGGLLFLVLAVVGIIIVILIKRKEPEVVYGVLIMVWLIASLWATGRGVRFILLMTPAIAIGSGYFFGIIHKYTTKLIKGLLV